MSDHFEINQTSNSKGEYDEIYIMLADVQALTDNFDHRKRSKKMHAK